MFLISRSIIESQTCKISPYNNSIWIFLLFPGIKISTKCFSHFHTLSVLACSQLRCRCVVIIKTNKRKYLGRQKNVVPMINRHCFPLTQLTFHPMFTKTNSMITLIIISDPKLKFCCVFQSVENKSVQVFQLTQVGHTIDWAHFAPYNNWGGSLNINDYLSNHS